MLHYGPNPGETDFEIMASIDRKNPETYFGGVKVP